MNEREPSEAHPAREVSSDASEASSPERTTPPEPRRRRPLLFALGALSIPALALVGVLALTAHRRHAEADEARARGASLAEGPRVEVATASMTPPGRTVTLNGEVHAFRQATLYAKVSGYLKYIGVDKGDRVKEGQVLGVIESPETEHEVASKRADLAIKKLTDQRYKSLAKGGLVSQADADRADADLAIAQSELSRLNALRGYQVIKAPFAGAVTARYADPGALLQAATGATQSALPLVDVAEVDRVRVYVYLAQNEALFAKEGDLVALSTEQFPDKKIQAKITRFTHDLDPKTRTMLTEVDVDNREAGFYPGTFVRVALTLGTPPTLAIAAEALMFRAGKPMVALVRDGRASFVPVVVGETDGQRVRVLDGLKEGDVVVLHPGDEVVDGGKVVVAAKAPHA